MPADITLDLDSEFSLGALYTMEQEGIPVLTEIISNGKKLSSVVSAPLDIDLTSSEVYKWPTLQVPSLYKPTWKKLCSILQLNDKESLAEEIKSYLKRREGIFYVAVVKLLRGVSII